ncbi:AAA family ATPase [Microbacteriaceae bacterium VKM Ac-2854]|nr:AAA family ATPase [Microbacteriaceae bacterium VKM Ac-2854]
MTAFALPESLAAKADPALIAADEEQFARIRRTLEHTTATLAARLDAERAVPGGSGQAALDRDLEVHRLSRRLRALRRFGLDRCLGRMVDDDGRAHYIGRLGLTDDAGERLLLDWRSPAAEPFFAATHAHPLGLISRRRYRWSAGRVSDYWDEAFTADALTNTAALEDQSAFIASLGGARSERMRDVLGTIQADQDAIIRAGSRGALVVDGGPGTGKTVVALHRAAYLLYSDPRLARDRGGVLFVGPNPAYLDYVADVLPNLGEDGVQLCTLRDLLPEGEAAGEEPEATARLKADARMEQVIAAAVRHYERPPTQAFAVESDLLDLVLAPEDWVEAFEAAETGTPHNEAREQVWQELLTILADQSDDEELARLELERHAGLRAAFNRAWPVLDPAGVLADLWSVPAYLRACGPWLASAEVAALQRADARAWTDADLPLLDAARFRIGDPAAQRRGRERAVAAAFEQGRMQQVVDELIAADDDGEGLVTMLKVEDAQRSLQDDSALPPRESDDLAGPFTHILVDEAQELTDAQWQMLLRRCPSRSFTVVGDRAQARHGFAPSWQERLEGVGLHRVEVASLSINYRTPAEVMAAAEPGIRAVLPDANVPTSVRESGVPVRYGSVAELEAVLAEHTEGTACVIGEPSFVPRPGIRSLTPELAKGLEFDLVVLVRPDAFGDGIEGAVDRYVAMTRATQRLVVLR